MKLRLVGAAPYLFISVKVEHQCGPITHLIAS